SAIDVGIGDALADPTVLDRPIADSGNALLVQLVVEEGAVVADYNEQRDAVMHRGPDRGGAHEEVAVAADRDRQPPRAFERERRADRHPRSAADAAAAFRADVIERMMEWPRRSVPGQRQVGEGYLSFADRSLERAREIVDPQRPVRRLVRLRPRLHRGGFARLRA